MKSLIGLLITCALSGCLTLPPVQLHSAPAPTAQEIKQIHEMQSRVLALGSETVFPRVLDVLMDNGYVVRSVDSKIGFVAFYQQWADFQQGGAIIALEGCAIFEAQGPASTRVRVSLTGGSQRLEMTSAGRSPDYGMVGHAQQSASAAEYKRMLDSLEAGLSAKKM
jgi:hypothetical protein